MDIHIQYVRCLPLKKAVFHPPADISSPEYKEFLPVMHGFIKKSFWRFAVSMPKTPHSYVCKNNLKNPEDAAEFVNVARFIQKYGHDEMFYKTSIRYLEVGLYRYWTMGYHWDTTIIINRALLGDKL